MKSNYTKPVLSVELFALAQSGSRDCTTIIPKNQINFNDPGKCVWDTGSGVSVFAEASNCDISVENSDVGCYNNPTEENYLFRS